MTSGKRERRGVGRRSTQSEVVQSHIHASLHPHSRHIFEVTHIPKSTPSASMLHPLIIGIMTVNTSLTVVYWIFLLGDVYFRWLLEPEDKPKKVVTPAWGCRHGPTCLKDCFFFVLFFSFCFTFSANRTSQQEQLAACFRWSLILQCMRLSSVSPAEDQRPHCLHFWINPENNWKKRSP